MGGGVLQPPIDKSLNKLFIYLFIHLGPIYINQSEEEEEEEEQHEM